MFLPNLAPMCPETIASYADVLTMGQEREYPMCRLFSGMIKTGNGHADTSRNLTPSTDGEAVHVGCGN
ncbi:hypothetical protein SAMN05216596_105123 [Pseudomonas congelans]|uniref:Uncharacterized protein n=1 Tax=Pseudomonas congelans TaxID=200452 RepID=A0A1H0TNA5_9PSED|nr:hypothetical protein [Pseudomonas sp. PvP027]PBP97974.1 hypothetical protein CCL24_11305 [Pseudomonas congelans]PBQ05947.1 hypothetical protein CCL07_11875 [Pseudomonas congelans]PBQ06216.1 hypothetical protein CCL17_03060 [Pseudomonas congelans]PBQ21462.1 hypothetical protein CCL08_04800 [Pseudomonas congelans]